MTPGVLHSGGAALQLLEPVVFVQKSADLSLQLVDLLLQKGVVLLLAFEFDDRLLELEVLVLQLLDFKNIRFLLVENFPLVLLLLRLLNFLQLFFQFFVL